MESVSTSTTTTTTTTTTYNQLQTDTDYLTYLYDYTSAGTTVSTQTLVTTGTSEETSSTGGTASTVYVTTDSNIYYNNTACSTVSSTCGVYELNYNNDKIDIHINPSNTKLVIVGQKTTGNVMESQIIGKTTGAYSNLIVIIQY